MQSCLCVMIDQKIDKNYQTVYREKLGKTIQSLISTDEIITMFKYTEHVVKVQEKISILEDDALTKAVQLLKSLFQTMKLFYCNKLRRKTPEHTPTFACCLQKKFNPLSMTCGTS